MKARIFRVLALVSCLATLATGLAACLLYYPFYTRAVRQQAGQTLAALAVALDAAPDDRALLARAADRLPGSRLTLVDPSGAVLYDTQADMADMDNHADRQEIAQALAQGVGEATRRSDTLGVDTYYLAQRLQGGGALRLARPVTALRAVFLNTLPLLAAALLAVALVSLWVSRALTRSILRPIGQAQRLIAERTARPPRPLAPPAGYEELTPFLNQIFELDAQREATIARLRAERDAIDNLTGNMQEGLVLLDGRQGILSINPSAQRMLGLPEARAYQGESFVGLDRDPELTCALEGALAGREDLGSVDIARAGRVYRCWVHPALDPEGGADGAMLLMMDVTEQVDSEAIRQNFAANVSHELKTPLTAIHGFAELMQQGLVTDPQDVKRSAAVIYREASRLIRLVGDLMRLSQIESGAPQPFERFCLAALAREVGDCLQVAADREGVDLQIDCPEIFLEANRSMIDELLYNLVDNAVKYNRPGGRVSVAARAEGDQVVLSVADTGIGIAPEHQGRVFERFYRVDKSRSKQTGGTGLGLSIVKHIVQYHHGQLALSSQEGRGTTVTVTLPAQQG
ncbi:MAG: ATP-binding protein [Christensenellales bacterium]|jgi:two-component system phosphate regulon sensor histidine kinase PhoR